MDIRIPEKAVNLVLTEPLPDAQKRLLFMALIG
jgi:hypothetical protein